MRSRLRSYRSVLALWACLAIAAELDAQVPFKRGDANCDGCVNCLDGEVILMFHSLGPAAVQLCCADAADADADGDVDGDDALLVLGLPPAPPPDCSPPGPISLGCSDYPADRCKAPAGDCAPPAASILAPAQVLLTDSSGVEVLFDGRASRGAFGGPASSFQWAALGLGMSLAPAGPHEAVTSFAFPAAGVYTVKLDVSPTVKDPSLSDPDDASCGHGEQVIEIVEPGPGLQVDFVPVRPAQQVVVAGRHFRLPLNLRTGPPGIQFQLAGAPAGMTVGAATGVIEWEPGIDDVGAHAVVVQAGAGAPLRELSLKINVLDPGIIAAAYSPPNSGGGGGQGEGAGVPPDPAPLFLEDLGVIPFDADLVLSANGPLCSVVSVTGQSAVRFDPLCDPGNAGSRGKVYSSGSSVAKLSRDVVNDFSIEAWISGVAPTQPVPEGELGYIFSVSGPGGAINWLLGAKGNGQYSIQVKLGPALETFDADLSGVDFAGLTPHQIVFVRSGSNHKLYADGVEKVVANPTRAGDLSAWDDDLRVHVGNSEGRTRPFAGDLYYCAFYVEAIDADLIKFLSESGPFIGEDDVPPPIAEVCPDPREIGRVEGDGTQSKPGWAEAGNGGGGAAADCHPLRPFTWDARALPSNEPLAWAPAQGSEACREKIDVTFDPATVRGIELTLTVEQMSVREHAPLTHTVTRRIFGFRRGDANADGVADLSDAVFILNYLFSGGAAPGCEDAADVDDSEVIDISDPIRALNYLFLGAEAPPAPGPAECGFDATQVALTPLGCSSYAASCTE